MKEHVGKRDQKTVILNNEMCVGTHMEVTSNRKEQGKNAKKEQEGLI